MMGTNHQGADFRISDPGELADLIRRKFPEL
jgi:hypothetical protein